VPKNATSELGDGFSNRDGRAERTARSRARMLDAFFALIGEGEVTPTAQQIAERANVGIRTVFRHFSEMETLFAEIDEMIRKEAGPYLFCKPSTGSVQQRATQLLHGRIRGFERFAPYLRATRVNRWRSNFLEASYARFVLDQRTALLEWLPELARAPQAASDAVELAVSFESWDRLRNEQGLGSARTQAALERTLHALLDGVN